jgi:hypothetical protein
MVIGRKPELGKELMKGGESGELVGEYSTVPATL